MGTAHVPLSRQVAPRGRALPRGFARVGPLVASVARAPAAWLFVAVWLAAVLILTLSGQGFPFDGLIFGPAYLLMSALTATTAAPPARPRLRLQLGLVLLFVALTAWRGLAFHRALAPDAAIPLWSPLVAALERLGGVWFGNDNYVANPVTYVALPLVALLLAGARLPDLGFGRGHRVGRVLLLWGALPLVYFALALLTGGLTLGRLLGRVVSNSMNNGFFEEFLFRGALQTRLRALRGPGWALVIQALVFGAWHLGLGYTNTDHAGLLPALASTIVYQATLGLAFGVLFERTRNLLAPSVAHILVNSLGI